MFFLSTFPTKMEIHIHSYLCDWHRITVNVKWETWLGLNGTGSGGRYVCKYWRWSECRRNKPRFIVHRVQNWRIQLSFHWNHVRITKLQYILQLILSISVIRWWPPHNPPSWLSVCAAVCMRFSSNCCSLQFVRRQIPEVSANAWHCVPYSCGMCVCVCVYRCVYVKSVHTYYTIYCKRIVRGLQ